MAPTAPTTTPVRAPAARPASPGAPDASGVTIDPRKLALQYWPWLLGSLVGGVVLGVVVHFSLLFAYPLYDGTVVFETLPVLEKAEEGRATVGEAGEAEMKRFIGNQTRSLVSDNVMMRAVDDPKVKSDTGWIGQFMKNGVVDRQEAARELEKITSARSIPESTWIELRVRTTSNRDAATLANAISDVYMQQLRSLNTRDSQEILEVMNRRLVAAQESQRELQRSMERLIGASRIEAVEEQFDTYSRQIEREIPVQVEAEYALEMSGSRLRQFEEQMKAPGGPSFPDVVREEVELHPVIVDLKRGIAGTKSTMNAYAQRLGINHPTVKQLDASVRGQEIELEANRQKLMQEAFARVIDRTRGDIESLESTLIELRTKVQDLRLKQAEVSKLREQYKQMEEEKTLLSESIVELRQRIEETKSIIDRAASNRVKVYAIAEVKDRPSFPDLKIMIPLVAFLVVSLTAGVIVLREALEQRVRGPADLAGMPRVRVLGVIPELSEDPSGPPAMETAVRDRPAGVIAESFRQVRGEIVKWRGRRDHAALLIVGGMPGSGATSFTANLAHSCVDSDHSVLVIDANLRRPNVHNVLGGAQTPGLSEVLSGGATFEQAVSKTDKPGLDILGAGTADGRGMERLTTPAMSTLLEAARSKYDLVLIDVAPTIVASDAVMLANRCDAVVLVVRAFGERKGLVGRVRNQLEDAKAEFLGVVINAVRGSAGGYFRRNFQATHRYAGGEPAAGPPQSGGRLFGRKAAGPSNGTASGAAPENGRLFDPGDAGSPPDETPRA